MKMRLASPAIFVAAAAAPLHTGAAGAAEAIPMQVVPSFAEQAPPPAPDYDDPASWAALPAAEGEAGLVPPGASPAARQPRADVFYIHPTTMLTRDRWNADIRDARINHWTDISVVARQASIFNGCCRIFAPRYRQGSPLAYAAMGGDGDKAYDLAYQDVLRAFEHYLAHANHGRPFIIVGHSQGALLAKRLVAERIEGSPLARRMVAAYIVGLGISEGEFGRSFHAVRPCTGPRQTGCVLTWNSFLVGSDTGAYRQRQAADYRLRYGNAGAELACTNPLLLSGRAEPSHGALPGEARDGPLQVLVPRSVTARCVDGVLMVDPSPALELKPLPGGNMHYHDMSMFYEDLRLDAIRRVDAFLARRRGA